MKITKQDWESKKKKKYRELSSENKNIKTQYLKNKYQNMSEENKISFKE